MRALQRRGGAAEALGGERRRDQPDIAAQPTWKRLVQAPLARNCRLPEVWLSAMPRRRLIPAASSPSTRAAAAAAPNAPQVAVGWKPRS